MVWGAVVYPGRWGGDYLGGQPLRNVTYCLSAAFADNTVNFCRTCTKSCAGQKMPAILKGKRCIFWCSCLCDGLGDCMARPGQRNQKAVQYEWRQRLKKSVFAHSWRFHWAGAAGFVQGASENIATICNNYDGFEQIPCHDVKVKAVYKFE